MPPASSSSFIPKRNPGAKPKQSPVKSIFLLSVISYSLFIAAPLASVGVFIYQLQAGKNSEEALAELDEAIKAFNESDYYRVLEFNDRLNAAKELNIDHVSVASTLDIIAKATADTVQFKSLNLTRTDTDTLTIKAALETSAFDGALFQRGQYDAQDLIRDATFSAVKFNTLEASSEEEQSSNQANNTKVVSLNAEFVFSAADIAYTPLTAVTTTAAPVIEEIPVSATGTTPSDVVNENNI